MMQHDSLKLGYMVDDNDDYDSTLFPYYAHILLKERIPTAAQIDAHMAKIRDAQRQPGGPRPELLGGVVGDMMWRMGPYMIKVGDTPKIFQEAENLLYLERNSTVRTQKLYAAFQSEGLHVLYPEGALPKRQMYYYMVMEGLHGFETMSDLEDEIRHMNALGRTVHDRIQRKFCELFGEQLRKLRSIRPNDPTHYGRINGRKYMLARPWFHEGYSQWDFMSAKPPLHEGYSHYGPFNYEELVERYVQVAMREHDFRLCRFMEGNPPMTPEEIQEMEEIHFLGINPEYGTWETYAANFLGAACSQDKVPVLTHFHIHGGNTVVKVIRDEVSGDLIDVEEVFLVNWGYMAWMPSWIEPGELLFREGNLKYRGSLRYLAFHHALSTMGHVNMDFVRLVRDFIEEFDLQPSIEV